MNREAAALGVPAYTPVRRAPRRGRPAADRGGPAARAWSGPRTCSWSAARATRGRRCGTPRYSGPDLSGVGARLHCPTCEARSAQLEPPGVFVHRGGQIAVDAGLVAAAYWLAFYFRFDGDVPGRYERLFAGTVLIVVGDQAR